MPDFDPSQIAIPNGHYIGGQIVDGDGAAIAVRRPSDAEAYADLPVASAELVDRAVTNGQQTVKAGRPARHASAPASCAAGPI
jgi:aldehyde dehydrogenase (NAD+)